jgi:hypothetical protein
MPHRNKRIFKAGARIFNEGEAQDIAYIIEEGEVEIFTEFNGERRTLNILGRVRCSASLRSSIASRARRRPKRRPMLC